MLIVDWVVSLLSLVAWPIRKAWAMITRPPFDVRFCDQQLGDAEVMDDTPFSRTIDVIADGRWVAVVGVTLDDKDAPGLRLFISDAEVKTAHRRLFGKINVGKIYTTTQVRVEPQVIALSPATTGHWWVSGSTDKGITLTPPTMGEKFRDIAWFRLSGRGSWRNSDSTPFTGWMRFTLRSARGEVGERMIKIRVTSKSTLGTAGPQPTATP